MVTVWNNYKFVGLRPQKFNLLHRSIMSNSLRPRGLQPARPLCPWDSPGKNTGVGCLALLQGILPTQDSCIAGRFVTSRATSKSRSCLIISILCHSGTFVKTDKPTMTGHNHPESTVDIMAVHFCGSAQMYNGTYPSSWYHIECFSLT